LILDSSLLIAEEREDFDLSAWLCRWIEKVFRRLEIVPLDRRVARMHSRLWARLSAAGRMIGPHDLIVAATALQRRWAVATFNAREFRHVPGLEVIQPQ
jgi:tRNA(fMet)-specific endonuclease VapC